MDFSNVNGIFNFYAPDVSVPWLQDALEHLNYTDVLVDLSIAAVTCGFLLGFYVYRRSRQTKTKYPSSHCVEAIRGGDLQEQQQYDIKKIQGVELFPKNPLSLLDDDSGLLTDDLSSSSSSSDAYNNEDIVDPLPYDISMPEKDVSDSKEASESMSATAKVVYKKMIQDGVNARLKLLLAEKSIYEQMKKMQRLRSSLHEKSVENPTQNCSLNKTSISISRRKTFFDTDGFGRTFLNNSTTTESNGDTTKYSAKEKLTNLKGNIYQLIDVHMKELSSLHVSIAEKRMIAKKLETMKQEIDSLCENTENETIRDKKSTTEQPNNKTLVDNMASQEDDKKRSYDKHLTNQLKSIGSLKDLFKNYDNEQELSTILEKSHENAENSLILLNDISTLQRDLKSVKKSWSRSSTPRKSPTAEERPVPT